MKGIPNAQFPAYVREDVKKVGQNAAVVIYLTDNGPVVVRNEQPRLQVVAVVGPGKCPKPKHGFQEAVLLEVGIGYSYPYHSAKVPKALQCKNRWCKDKIVRTKRRHPLVRITKEQYLQVAPLLFAEMQKIVNRRIAARKKRNHLNPPYKPVTRLFHSHRKSTLFEWDERITVHPGCHFSVSIQDTFLLSDIYWLEQKTDSYFHGRTEGLAHRITKRLARYAKNDAYWNPEKLKGFKDVDRFINYADLPAYKCAEVLRLIKDNPKRRPVYVCFQEELVKRLGNNGEIAPETELANRVLPNPENRLCVLRNKQIEQHLEEVARSFGWSSSLIEGYRQKISKSPVWNRHYQILVTTGLGKKDHIVFKMTHSLPTEIDYRLNKEEVISTPVSV